MDKRVNRKLEVYVSGLKDGVKSKCDELGLSGDVKVQELLRYVYDYERLQLSKEDFAKRVRAKNVVSLNERCGALRSNGEQCTRKRKDVSDLYCGTHLKGLPHGSVLCMSRSGYDKMEVWAEDIGGIMYYIDVLGNVYLAEDIMRGVSDPRVISRYVNVGGVYSIPEFKV
jgi:hypothetical protein